MDTNLNASAAGVICAGALNILNAIQLRPLLVEKCVILTGGRDKLNNVVIQFPNDSQLDRLSSDELQSIILYLASIPCGKNNFVFVIDMRGRKYEAVKPILKILQNLQENYNYNIHHVYIIKPDNFWQKQKTSFASSKYSFEHSLISIEQLTKYLDQNQLTHDLEGSLPYNNDQWIDFRIKLENFLSQTSELIGKFNQLQIELSSFDQPDSKEACQEAILAHTNTKQRIFGITIEQTINEGRNLLKVLNGHENNELLLAPGGTRDSGYSGSESEKFNCDYFNEAGKIKESMEQLRTFKQKVQTLWQQKKLKLEQCLQLRVFEQDCSQMMDWLSYNNKCVLLNYTDIGQSYSSAYELLQKHEQFHKNCFTGAASIQHITSVANKLIASSHYASNLITLKTNKLEKEWQLFHSALQNRQKILSASCMFHNKADQYLNKVGEWKALCSSNQVANSVQEAESLLKKHHELSDEISQIYAEVCNDGKAILDSIQSSQSAQIGQMEFKQAASHILDIVYEILSNHRQLEILWVNKKQKLQNRYRILNFQQNIKQVYNWLENHGEVFLRRNQSIGKNLMRAKMLHLSHENFVKVLKNTITNVEKLLASADDLVINGEFDPQDVYSMTKELEQRMTSFLQRVEKRKNILDLSVLFHTHVVELDNWFNELKLQWTSLNLNDINLSNQSSMSLDLVTSCIDNIEKHLEVLNEQKTVTNDAVDKTLVEGDNLLVYLKEVNNKPEQVNNDQQPGDSASATNGNSKQSNSYLHLEGIVNSVKTRYNDVDKLLSTIKLKLESNLQIKLFEKDALEASQNLEQWAEELKYLDENEHEERSSESAESWLHSQIQTANQMQVLVFELLQRGSDLLQQSADLNGSTKSSESASGSITLNELFNTSDATNKSTSSSKNATAAANGSESSNPSTPTPAAANQHTLNWLKQQNSLKNEANNASNMMNLTTRQRIQSFIEYLNEREKELHELAIKQQRKLGQTLQINQLENECTQLLNYISNIEMTLFSLLKFARNLDEAEQIKKEHEIFKSNLERVSISVNMLQSKSQRILIDKQQHHHHHQQQQHPQVKVISKFEQLMNSLNSKWQMLLIYIDNRTRLIMAQINFYKYTDQVTTVLESLEHEYTREEDWYEKSKLEYDPEQYLQAQIQIHNQKKQSFLKACNWARRTGETFQKYSLRNICDAKMNTSLLNEIDANTKKIMDDIHVKEERTIKSWTNRKNALDECFQYVIFEKSSKEALAWLNESETSYLNKFQNLANNKEEMKKLYKEFCEFTERLKNQQGYVNLLIELSPKLLESSSRYGANIAMWANKVETRYKEFFNLMSKVQQSHSANSIGASVANSLNNSMASLISSSSILQNNSSSLLLSSPQSANSSFICNDSNKTTTTDHTTSAISASNRSAIENKKKQEMLKQNEHKQKLIKKRQNIITEIIQTEKSYVQDLCACLETYYKEFVSNVSIVPDYLKGKEAIIFGNLEEIYNFHKNTFLVELENYENMPEDIGHCFVIYADQFQIYVEYCKNKENSTKLLMEDTRFDNFFEKIQRGGQLKCSLDSYLIKPIQRITKYQLLLKDLLSCCEDNRSETKDALDVMMNVPKKANDAIHLSLLEGLEEGLSKEALGDVLLQDKFQVWDSKQLIKKGKDRHVFLFETSLVFAKEVKDPKGKLKYVYKFKLMTSEINITEHMEGDSCKLAVWTGRAPLSDHRVILKSNNLEVKQIWVKKIRELIQEKYFYLEVAMCEAGQRSNRNSKDFEIDADFNPICNSSTIQNGSIISTNNENLSSAASNASSGTKASNEITTLQTDYITSDNVHLFKGQHVQIVQRINNDFCLVQLLNNVDAAAAVAAVAANSSSTSSPTSASSSLLSTSNSQATNVNNSSNSLNNSGKQVIEVQIPVSLIKCRHRNTNYEDDADDVNNKSAGSSSSMSAAAKRKGSFKKWLRSSHRKLTSNSANSRSIRDTNGAQKLNNSDLDSLKIKKVLSNSEDLKMKNWLIEETNNEDSEEINNSTEQVILENPSTMSLKLDTHLNQSNSNTNDEDQDDLTSSIPPPMNVIKAEQSEQNTTGSFNKIPANQSIDIQKELKLWQSKMESKKAGDLASSNNSSNNNVNISNTNNNNGTSAFIDTNSSNNSSNYKKQTSSTSNDLVDTNSTLNQTEPQQTASPQPTTTSQIMNAETKLTYAIKELLNTEKDYVNDLAILIEKYMEGIKRNEVPMPQDMVGKEKFVFGNIQQIYEWHKSTFCPELDKCFTEPTSYIGQLFIKYENRFQMYVKYCENKPKSEFIVSEYDGYFEELRVKLNQKLNIQDLLIKPVQRIMKYQLMLKEIKKFMEKEGLDCKSIDRAIEIMVTVPKNADDMMNVGRLQGFEGRITAQGRLLLQDTLLVQEPEEQLKKKKDQQVKYKERRVFLFQQIIIFSEMQGSNKKFTSPKYIFKSDMKVNKLHLDKDDAQLTFTLHDKTPQCNRRIVCQCEDVNKYNNWISHLQDLLDMQNQFLRDLQNPTLAKPKTSSSTQNNPITSSPNSSSASIHANNNKQSPPQQEQTPHQHHSIASQFNDFLKSTFNSLSGSSGGAGGAQSPNAANQSTMTNRSSSASSTLTNPSSPSPTAANNANGNGTHPLAAKATANVNLSYAYPYGSQTSSSSSSDQNSIDYLNADLAQQLTLGGADANAQPNVKNNNNNTSAIPNFAKVICSYTAITEDEITVQKGDLVQIIVANMHNRFLVHREANEHQPAAEGWIPGFVIGSQLSNSTNAAAASSNTTTST